MADPARQERTELTARWIDTAIRPDLSPPPVQRKGGEQRPAADGHRLASQGVPGTTTALPHPDQMEQELQGTPIQELGIAYKNEGVNLRDQPASSSQVKRLLPLNTRMFVDSEQDGYYFVTTDDGQFGYVAQTHVKLGLPEPNAKIYYIESNDTALAISRKHYGGQAEWGRDHRFLVNGLVHVNQGPGQCGIFKPGADADWDRTQVQAGYMIWVPSLDFMRSLQGAVESGSITHDAWEATKQSAQAVGDFVLGTGAFIAGALHGALESLWDILVGLGDLAVMAWDILKSLVSGDLLSDARGLWDELSGLAWDELVQGWIGAFDQKWNHEDLLAKWHFRGWVIGYVIAEVVMLVWSGGVIQGIKWAGKAAKASKLLRSLPRVTRFADAARDTKAAKTLSTYLSKVSGVGKTTSSSKAFVGNLLDEPVSIWNKGPYEIAEAFRKAGFNAKPPHRSPKGSKRSRHISITEHPQITNIQVHPGGGATRRFLLQDLHIHTG